MRKPRAVVFDVPIDDVSCDELIQFIVDTCISENKSIVANVNVYALNQAYQLPRFREFFNKADVVFCDGFGVKWGGRLLGFNIKHRYTPPDWIDLLSDKLCELDITVYFLGGKPDIAQKAARNLMDRHPGLRIEGWHHGYFNKKLGSVENVALVEDINRVKPNLLFVGFGMPLQEFWLMDNWSQIQANVALPVGALFDYVAETMPRAPRWMTDNGLEWLGRLIVEPQRLWRRYIIGNPLFLLRILKQRFGLLKLD